MSTTQLNSLIVTIAPAANQTVVNERFDAYLDRYVNLKHVRGPQGFLNVSRPVYFSKTDAKLSGTHVVNETKVYGLDDMERYGNITIKRTGRHSFNVKGQLLLAAPKIEGSVYLTLAAADTARLTYYSIANADIGFEFESNVNNQWNQVTFDTFNYNNTAPMFPVTISQCPTKLVQECGLIVTDIAMAVGQFRSMSNS